MVYIKLLIIYIMLLLGGCYSRKMPYSSANNICHVFDHHNSWHYHAKKAEHKWGVPVHIIMAIIYKESSFNGDARRPMRMLAGIIPWGRASSAYGYCQAIDSTWQMYKKETKKTFVFRNSFADATDFIGWMVHRASERANISKHDSMRIYLAYHEGIGGYMRQSYKQKPEVLRLAAKVQDIANMYKSQLHACNRD